MLKETAKYLKAAAEETGNDEYCRIDEEYSGRGMYGDKTHAIIVDPKDIFELIAIAAVRVQEDEDSEEGLDDYGHEAFVEDMRKLRQDNMGRDSLVFY